MPDVHCPHCGETIYLSATREPRAKARKFNHEEARALLAFGAKNTELAEFYGVTPQAISALKKAD